MSDDVCVCVQQILRRCLTGSVENQESQEGEVCVKTHKRNISSSVNYTTTIRVLKCVCSVDVLTQSTHTLHTLVRGGVRE